MPAGIETTYKGTTYRSRTEARWAVLLELLRIPTEYEPFDANGYIPDFVAIGGQPLLIEVKPDVSIHTMAKHITKIERGLRGVWNNDVIIIGSTPMPYAGPGPTRSADYLMDPRQPVAGIMGEYGEWDGEPGWVWDCCSWFTCTNCGSVGWFHQLMTFKGRPCGCYEGDHYLGQAPSNIQTLWGTTRDVTRWEP